ncbi:hypothetical protein H6G41_25575 [Tolypothrix sp. FACHB-123]|uniref:hypothetical protein n=1 Tax=Tolypothrix sp. FACHB-123 TaxID=2692868 RepID=UPI0016882BBA|nr:hypothetical protein [Tolypothrix sp. FACHB-123]MBD2357942.1 hypothetical protein [Tolypothrix sp. FACHB-123]
MSNTTIRPKAYLDPPNERFNEFNCQICDKFRFALNNINSALILLIRVRLDQKKKRIALEFIEENARMQGLLLDELLNGRYASAAASQSLLGLVGEMRFVINTISSWSKSLHSNQLEQSTLIQGIEVMEHHARNQNELIDRLENWILTQNQLACANSDRE